MTVCYHLSLYQNLRYLQQRFGATFDGPLSYEPSYHRAAFSNPSHPVIADDDPAHIRPFGWGLIPRWARTEEQAARARRSNYNTRSETMFEKPSFRASARDRRCLVLADGFFEWRHVGGKRIPHYIRLRDHEAFAFAGLWDEWKNGSKAVRTFSIVTTDASPLLARIHNTKKRMPVILHREDERRWLEKGLSRDEIGALLRPYDDDGLEAYAVAPLTGAGRNPNGPEIIAPVEHKDLRAVQKQLF